MTFSFVARERIAQSCLQRAHIIVGENRRDRRQMISHGGADGAATGALPTR
jgi:hypothetical protein